MTGINFGGYGFSEPEPLPAATIAYRPQQDSIGLYAIVVFEARCNPRPYRPIYFGESSGIVSRATSSHENYSSWAAEAGPFTALYRAFCSLPGWTRMQRQRAESALIAEYNPPCNERLSVSLSRLLAPVTSP